MIRQIKHFNFKFLITVYAICIYTSSMGQDKIVRKELMTANIGSRVVKKVDVREINFQPGQKVGYHKHPCPVVRYIVSGSVIFQVEGDTLKTLKAGDAFFEPADVPIIHFDNASEREPMRFIAYYLLNKETELIQMLPPKAKD